MSYDDPDDPAPSDRKPPPIPPMRGDDLETIVSLLEFAGLILTTKRVTWFTRAELIAKAKQLGGPEITMHDRDILNVLANSRGIFVKKAGKMRVQ